MIMDEIFCTVLTLFGCGFILFIFASVLTLIMYHRYHKALDQLNERSEALEQEREALLNHIEDKEEYLAMKNKKIISLTPDQLDNYLGMIFGNCLEIASATKVSERDPNATETLYTYALKDMMEYVGEEQLIALDYYYGEGFLEKWCQMRFNLLNLRGMLNPVIKKEFTYNTVNEAIATKEREKG